ncbi:class I SAM-dependent methyltransferase [Mycobacterium sp. OAS707]
MSLWNAGDGALEQRIGGPLQVLATKVKTQIKRQLTMSQAERAAKLGARDDGRDWPRLAHTMIGRKRMENLRFCMEDVLANDVPGDFIETGVWRGGACIFMRGILAARGVTDRRVWVADSFAGLPPPNAAKYPADARGKLYDCAELAVPLETVKATFERYGLLDDNVRFLKGWFKDTLPSAPIERLAVARLDGDMYESTIDALTNLYPKLSPGGYLIVDDYGAVRACRRAVADYRAEYGIEDPIVAIDSSGVFWQKSG